VSYEQVPGFVSEHDAYEETTLIVEAGTLREAAAHLRREGFNFLADVAAADYLGYGACGVSGYIGTAGGRDLNTPMTQGLQAVPIAKPKRFSVSYHLLELAAVPRRLRLQVWVDDREPVPSVIEIWPTADWHEREAFDLLGINVVGHPNLARILTDDDWDGHPLRKDYPIGGEPVRFSEDR
jgi:NADH:ubiquinone oxidoreductase subunit C